MNTDKIKGFAEQFIKPFAGNYAEKIIEYCDANQTTIEKEFAGCFEGLADIVNNFAFKYKGKGSEDVNIQSLFISGFSHGMCAGFLLAKVSQYKESTLLDEFDISAVKYTEESLRRPPQA